MIRIQLSRAALLAALFFCASCAFGQGTAMKEPDDKPAQITGCMTARTKTGGFILSRVFGPPVTILGPNYLQAGMGHEVTLSGTWESNGTSSLKAEELDDSRMFIATSVKITARQCASPPSAPAAPTKPAEKSSPGN